MTWPVVCDASAPFGQRLAQVAASALADGTLGETHRPNVYRDFVACGFAQDLSHVRTSCAVFVRACLHWAGRLAAHPGVPGQGIFGGWLEGLTPSHPSWRKFGDLACAPETGAIFYVEAASNPYNNHVGVLIAPLDAARDVWITAEGGGGDGTDCKLTWRRWGFGWDARPIRGLWLPGKLDHVGAPPPAPSPSGAMFPIVYHDLRKDIVKSWQLRLLTRDPACLPAYGADGGYGDETVKATETVQAAAGLPRNGRLVDAATWGAAGP